MEQLDLARWPRRAAFEYFRGFHKPWFSLCFRVDAAPLKAAVAASGVGSFWLGYHFMALALMNRHVAFRYRFASAEGGSPGVRVLPAVHAGTTVPRSDGSFGFATLRQQPGYTAFCAAAAPVLARARDPAAGFLPQDPGDPGNISDALIHCTTLPWVHFSSFEHARAQGVDEDIPKLAFGRAERDNHRLCLPVAVEVHHALMDGVDVGRWVQDFEAALAQPQPWLNG